MCIRDSHFSQWQHEHLSWLLILCCFTFCCRCGRIFNKKGRTERLAAKTTASALCVFWPVTRYAAGSVFTCSIINYFFMLTFFVIIFRLTAVLGIIIVEVFLSIMQHYKFKMLYEYYIKLLIRSTLWQSRPNNNKASLKCPSMRMYVHASVRKRFFWFQWNLAHW